MFKHIEQFAKRGKTPLLVVPFWKGKKGAEAAAPIGAFEKEISTPIDHGDFKGDLSETTLYYNNGSRVLLLGLGDKEKVLLESLRNAFSAACFFARSKKIVDLSIVIPDCKDHSAEKITAAVAEGFLLSNYSFDQLKSEAIKKEPTQLIKTVDLIGCSKKAFEEAKKFEKIVKGVYLARDLANGNADDITPQELGRQAKLIEKEFEGVKAQVHDKKWIEKEKMGLLLAVNRGSNRDPAFIVLEYKGNPKSKDVTVVVGKGVTYDTGGLNLKPTGFMETMKCDMSGAACALGTIVAAASLKLKKNVTAVIPTTENGIDATSYKPGDVYTSYLGKTVEITNTDAEGRLILADALAWTCKNLKPSRIIDFATLTGAVVVALGDDVSGLMGTNKGLEEALFKAGEETCERVWPLPLYDVFFEHLKSDVADIANCGTGRQAGSITAALFLKEFVEKDVPWAHLDIAGTAFLKGAKNYRPKGGTGVGVRLMIELLENLS